jgi:hypothetical protein
MNQNETAQRPASRGKRVSPKGLIQLPAAARQALGLEKGKGGRIGLGTEGDTIILTPEPYEGQKTRRISPRGLLQLSGEPRKTLTRGQRRYRIDLDSSARRVVLSSV